MNDNNLNKIISELVRHSQIGELQNLDIDILRKLEDQADKDLLNQGVLLDHIKDIVAGQLKPEDLRKLEKDADIALVDASNRLQWIRSVIDKKLGAEGSSNETNQ